MTEPPGPGSYQRRIAPLPGMRLTKREVRIVELAAEGMTNEQIGNQLYLEASTIKTRLARIAIKLGASGRTNIVHRSWQEGYLMRSQAQPAEGGSTDERP